MAVAGGKMSFAYAQKQIAVLGSDFISVIHRHKKSPFF
jgi:hypothetical protein